LRRACREEPERQRVEMLAYRTFHNTDPPALAAIWRSRAGEQGRTQPVSTDLLEQSIFSKLYFDYQGMHLALEDGRPVGFAHAGFGPDETRNRIATEAGITCMVVVQPECPQAEVASGLLERCEAYLLQRGATVLYGGAVSPRSPFYLGLYGGSELPGVLQTDSVGQQLFRLHGYEEEQQVLILRRRLSGFRPLVDRRQQQLRRQMIVRAKADPPARDWWEACTTGDLEMVRFEASSSGNGSPLASLSVRSIDLEAGLGCRRTVSLSWAVGLSQLEVHPSARRQGLATLLLNECLRQLAAQGCEMVEVHAGQGNQPALDLLRRFQFQQAGLGTVFRKSV